jgi:hypothetical protein
MALMRARWTGEATGVPGSLPRVIQVGVPVVLAENNGYGLGILKLWRPASSGGGE